MTFRIDPQALQLTPVSPLTPGSRAVLKGNLQIGNGEFHVFAYQVDGHGDLVAAPADYILWESDLQQISELCGDRPSTVDIDGLPYVLVIYPYGA